ncbi:Predicted amidohydrolase [Austwickia chelonae]|uniref:Putative hydrolase n=1 Tax=Austwickia chelonae NBRC 105200 TaxID=1184607 RepID=K6WAQ7_9MICO|nr:carbon-nitrogen hydrolase family protein [Austwickia chelonae]GAB78932.1 putative hydrolase [Austwickia chelonae NBRC 105200]SEV86805.1 Predicted amidohydrolase [Austwickia chelonae]
MTPSTVTVAAAQIHAGDDPTENLSTVTEQAGRAADAGARIVVFPEATMAAFGNDLSAVAEPLDGPFADGVRRAAERHRITVVVGMFTPATDGRVHNTLLLTGPDGECSYDKIHLYDAFGSRESDTVAPGDHLVTTQVAGITVGLATCFDLRFATQFIELGRAGSELVVVPACWGDGPGKAEQWDLLVRARAMDAQSYLLACDMAWQPPSGRAPRGIGRSALSDPLGVVRARLSHTPSLLLAEVAPHTVHDTRKQLKTL